MATSNPLSGAGLLYTIEAVIVVDNEGNRLLAKYYNAGGEQSSKEKGGLTSSTSLTKKAQDAFEATLFARTRKALNSTLALYLLLPSSPHNTL